MPKKPPRKPPRRLPQRQPLVDSDLIELAQVLDERREAQNAEGWFLIPWRNGWNAVDLALGVWSHAVRGHDPEPTHLAARDLIAARALSASAYHEASDLLGTIPHRLYGTAALRAALRCYQCVITRTHGEHYNDILRSSVTDDFKDTIVMRWRCHDAIGVFPQLQNDANDRKRRAFTIAWSRGLYHAAYAIGPVKELQHG